MKNYGFANLQGTYLSIDSYREPRSATSDLEDLMGCYEHGESQNISAKINNCYEYEIVKMAIEVEF